MVLKILFAFLWSGVKYLIGAASCLVLFNNPALGFLVATSGALSGIIFFTYGSLWVEERITKKYFSKRRHFTRTSRLLIKLKRGGGLPLVALLTPVFLSIPLGCILATTFVHSRERIVIFMCLAAIFWGVIIFGSQWLFHLDLTGTLRYW